jgi:integrase
MSKNPVKFWKPESHQARQKQGLTTEELKKVFGDPIWRKDFLMNGKVKIDLGYKLQDYLLLLFLSCKRRGEVINLQIEDVNFTSNYVSYVESKNSSRGTIASGSMVLRI